MQVVTISATYGTGGSVIGPAVAEHLDVPFVDRAIPSTVAEEIGCSLEEAMMHDDRAAHGLGRLLAGAARMPTVTFGGIDVYLPDRAQVPQEEFVETTEKVIRDTAARQGGVILGRAGAVVLADLPGALHVRLDAPKERRIAQAAASLELSEREARRQVEGNDRAREAYVRHFYHADPADPDHYQLTLDPTVIPVPVCVDLVVMAARSLG